MIALLQRGMQLQKDGALALAHECYREVLERDPNQPDALHLMGVMATEAMAPQAAIRLFKRALPARPDDPALRANYGNALIQIGDAAGAERQLTRSLKLRPDDPETLVKLAHARAMLGDDDAVAAILEHGLTVAPASTSLRLAQAEMFVSRGLLDEARAIFRDFAEAGPERIRALAGLVECTRFSGDPPEREAIRALLAEGGLTLRDIVRLCYAGAKIAEETGRYDEAFDLVRTAKAHLDTRHDEARQARSFAALKALYTPELFRARRNLGDRSDCPVFIVGMPRSGTTLVEQIVSAHPQAAGAGELADIPHIARDVGFDAEDGQALGRRVASLSAKESRAFAARYLERLRRVSAVAARVTDKMPHNFEHLGLIALLFPKAKIIHCRRSPLDTCLSVFMSRLRDSAYPYAGSLETLGRFYRDYAALMAHWRAVLPMPILDVDYESVVARPEQEARRLIDFIGLEWDPRCLDFQSNSHAVHTLSSVQVRQPLYSSSIGRWRRFETHLGPLREALGDLADA